MPLEKKVAQTLAVVNFFGNLYYVIRTHPPSSPKNNPSVLFQSSFSSDHPYERQSFIGIPISRLKAPSVFQDYKTM
jgi:hypothetical protein